MGGIMGSEDALEFVLAGASAIAIGTANFVDPKTPIKVIEGIKHYLKEKGINNFQEFILSLAVPQHPIPADTPDGEPIRLILFAVAPPEKNILMLQSRAALLKIITNPRFAERIIGNNDPDDIWNAIDESGVSVKEQITASDIMITDILTISPDTTVEEIIEKILTHHIESLPVVSEGKMIGLVSGIEILKAAIPYYVDTIQKAKLLKRQEPLLDVFRKSKELTAKKIMRSDFKWVSPGVSAIEIAFLMVHNRERYLFVLSDNNELTGLIARTDLISKLVE